MVKQIPHFLQEKLMVQYGQELTNKIVEGYRQKRQVSFRVNNLKINQNKMIETLNQQKIMYDRVTWNPEAFVLKEATEEQIKSIPIYEKGEIYLQSLSSMLPVIILEPKAEENILDMAAAPRRKNYTNSCDITK